MGINQKIFSEENVGKTLFKFAVPAIISLLVLELYNMVDTVYVGRFVGANAIGGLTVAFPLQRLLISIGMLISVGASTFVARNLGEKNLEGLKQAVTNALMLIVVSLASVIFIILIFKNSILFALGASPNTFNYAEEYISIILIGGLFQGITVVICYIMTALGNTKITLYSNLLGAISNIIINYLLIALLGLGVSGAAVATIISQFLALIFVLNKFKYIIIDLKIDLSFKAVKKSFSSKLLISIVVVGFSTFIIEISDAVVSVVLNNLLVSQGGDGAVIIVGVITKISMFMFITIIGISSSMQPIVAYNYGCSNYLKMKEALKITIIAVSIASISAFS
jgi:putative MATE family efflux protein